MQNPTKIKTSGSAYADYSFSINLMQFLVVPAFVLDIQGRVLIWNKACERLTGVLASEVVGTNEHWRGFYDNPRPCLADLLVQHRVTEIEQLYLKHDDATDQSHGIHAENWCVMPQIGTQLYLAIDAGPIYDEHGNLLAVVETLRDMTSLKVAQTALEKMAIHDGLTGIVNRRGFDDKLSIEWSRSAREQKTFALLMIDVDHFKRYNDRYGHQAGDECLKQVASVIEQEARRPSDTAARYGGEEFAVILPLINELGALTVANRIMERIAQLKIPHIDNDGFGVITVSIGISSVMPDVKGEISKDDLIRTADRALYQAKEAGRNCAMVQSISDMYPLTHQ
jgi:diguanylate cyclase (GGDEF)-like protein